MNCSLSTNHSNSSQLEVVLDLAREIANYGIPAVSVIGTLFQIATIIVFTNTWFQHCVYDFLQCRSVCNLVVCLVGIFNQQLPLQYCHTDYSRLSFDWCVLLLQRSAYIASVISDNLLILNRLATLHEWKASVFNRLSKKVSIQR